MSHFVGREEDIINITGYLDFATTDVQVVHIVGPPGFGKSTLAMKIGEIFLRKWVRVHYADVKMVKDIDTVAEKIVLSMVESRKTKVMIHDLKIKMQKQYSKTLILLDNCDEIFEQSKVKEEFLEALKESPQKTVKYLLTSQKWIANIGNFRLHAIYNLSSKAAMELLSKVAPSLTADMKRQIVDLTGNVPLALKVVGAIFSLPDAPVPEMVIRDLKEHPLRTLNRTELYPNDAVSRSIHTAYSYLTPELKQLCINLSHFPGSFDESSAHSLFGFDTDIHSNLANLVQRSLLQSSHGRQRYHFHQLIKTFFLSQENRTSFQLHFDIWFQSHFTFVLKTIISEYKNGLKLSMFDEEKQNIRHMFTLFKTTKNKTVTFNGMETTLQAIESNVLQLRFFPVEINNISRNMLEVLDSFTLDEQAMVNLFFTTYIRLVKLVAEQQWPLHKGNAIQTLTSRVKSVNDGYESGKIEVGTFTKFYSLMIQYYEVIRDTKSAAKCHAHILKTINGQLRHCYPNCNYYDISVAYHNIRNRTLAFYFRELAYKYQFNSLDYPIKVMLLFELHRDYSHNNDSSKAKKVSAWINNKGYPFLTTTGNAAGKYEYIKELYYAAVYFFRANEQKLIELQNKMIKNTHPCSENNCTISLRLETFWEEYKSFTQETEDLMSRCEFKCAVYYAEVAEGAYKRECYYLAIWAGEQSIGYFDKLGEQYTVYKYVPESIVGRSHYEIGNNSSHILLKQALKHINNVIRHNYFSSLKLKGARVTICGGIILANWVCNPLFYIYILKDITAIIVIFVPICITIFPYFFWVHFFEQDEGIISTETGLTQRNTFFWSQLDVIEKWSGYSYSSVGEWIFTLIHFTFLAVGTIIFYFAYSLLFYYYIVPCIFNKRALYTTLFISFITVFADFLF